MFSVFFPENPAVAIPLLCQAAGRTGLFCKNKIHLPGGSTTCTHTWGHPRGLSRGYHLPFSVSSLVSAECTLQARPGPHPPAAFSGCGFPLVFLAKLTFAGKVIQAGPETSASLRAGIHRDACLYALRRPWR